MQMGAGIDYGMGRTNINRETGIRYGVISQHSVCQAWADCSEADYGDPTCPKCGGVAISAEACLCDIDNCESGPGCADYVCEPCEYVFDSSEAYGDEPRGWHYSGDGYECVDCLDSDIMILQSPYYTYAPFCSPCVPGAGNIDSTAGEELDGVRTYCLGHDWFDSGKAPYRVFDAVYDVEILPADGVTAAAEKAIDDVLRVTGG
jgi:hypothetical protein